MTENYKRASDADISEIRAQIKHLAESDEHLFREVSHIRKDTAEGFAALRELIQKQSAEANDRIQKQSDDAANRNKPQWQVYGLGLGLLGAFFAYQINQITTPLKEGMLLVDRRIEIISDKMEAHQKDGHPHTVISKIDTLKNTLDTRLNSNETIHNADVTHLKRWIKRVDTQGSVVHYGPYSEKHEH